MNSNRFNELLDRYLADVATADERDELMTMIEKGSHDEHIHDKIQSMFSEGHAGQAMERERANEILRNILPAGKQVNANPSERSSSWKWYAAAAVVFAGMSVGWWISIPDEAPAVVATSSVEQESGPVIFTGKQFVRLPDGSTVLLNEGTRLSYEATFGDNDREVMLVGEGYFEVRRDETRPFRVVTGKVTTTVLGTAFNVTAYPGKEEVQITVTTGKVQVDNDHRLVGIISPDQQISVNTVTNSFVQRAVKAETAMAWQSQYLILDDISLEEAARVIANKYEVKISLANKDLNTCRISATFLKGESLEQVLTVVSGVVQATYTIDSDGDVRIDGKGCI